MLSLLGDQAPCPFSRPLDGALLPLVDEAEKLLSGIVYLLPTPMA